MQKRVQAAIAAEGRSWRRADASLSALLIVQVLMTFVAIPLSALYPEARALLDIGHLVFAAVCALALTRRRVVRFALLASLMVLASGPYFGDHAGARAGTVTGIAHNLISGTAFVFNTLVSLLVARRAFGPGRVTGYRVQGAVLIYLNVASLFAIAYGILEAHAPGAIRTTSGALLTTQTGARGAELSYFSLATITTTGYGDLAPVHPLARSLANLEAVFGQLFLATFLARLVSLHLAHSYEQARTEPPKEEDQP